MIESKRMYERLGLIDSIPAQLANNTTKSTGWQPIAEIRRLLAIINLGATDTTLDAVIQKATDSGGTGAATVASITQFSGTDDNKLAQIDVDVAANFNGYTHARLLLTIGNGTTGANVAATFIAGDTRYGEEYAKNATNVAQIVKA